MRIFVKKAGKQISLSYRELAEKMWFKEIDGKELEISHAGNDETLREDSYLSLTLDKWLNDERWKTLGVDFNKESLDMELSKNENNLFFMTKHIDILTVDRRALYIMVSEIAKEVGGDISEDEQSTWISVEEFEAKHQKVLKLTYEQANDISLDEVKTMKAIEEPWDYDE